MARTSNKRRRHEETAASSDEEVVQAPKKVKTKTAVETSSNNDDEGNTFWALSANRRVVIQNFKGKTYINIREYYDANGVLKPGKKGIMLSLEQYSSLLAAVPAVNAELQSKGHDVPDISPNAPGASAPRVAAKASPSKEKKKKKKKMNIEATSDEEDSESD
ncbi:transcriptional Coactivator p15-domain-containing protein [Xylaria intraflava]|nr:transcriptional Coactivator p15-domain-containing protein [Xylaria intraflava]